ncbi:MAG: DUF4240 domain-containing protein [Fimbriimonadaceae bacterium]|nr:DUF4240 domain-containing protein [Fimbriimonadaceae bacterium]
MDEAQFWRIIEGAGCEPERVKEALDGLEPDQIDAWDRIYWEKHNALHRWDVWGAAFVINGGCGDDSFHYFKAWVIGKGPAAYQAALSDPDSLGAYVTEEDLENGCDNELLNYAAAEVFEAKTGEELESRSAEGDDPAGEAWEEDELDELFPRLAKRFF